MKIIKPQQKRVRKWNLKKPTEETDYKPVARGTGRKGNDGILPGRGKTKESENSDLMKELTN